MRRQPGNWDKALGGIDCIPDKKTGQLDTLWRRSMMAELCECRRWDDDAKLDIFATPPKMRLLVVEHPDTVECVSAIISECCVQHRSRDGEELLARHGDFLQRCN